VPNQPGDPSSISPAAGCKSGAAASGSEIRGVAGGAAFAVRMTAKEQELADLESRYFGAS